MYKCKKIMSIILVPGDEIPDELYEKIEDRFKYKFSKIEKINKRKK